MPEKPPAGATLAMLPLGLSNALGACATTGAHMRLRGGAKANDGGKIVLAQTLAGPRGVIDYARNWHQKAGQSSRAPKALGRARGKRAAGAAAFATGTGGCWLGEGPQTPGGAEPAGGDIMGYDRGWAQQPPPGPQGHHWAAEQAKRHSLHSPLSHLAHAVASTVELLIQLVSSLDIMKYSFTFPSFSVVAYDSYQS